MQNVSTKLPDDVNALKELIAEQAARNTDLERENARISAKVLSLQEQLNLALALRYAASSEKLTPDQIRLFDEAEVDALAQADNNAELDETVGVPAHSRKKCGRKKLPATLPRVEVVHELSTEDRICPHDGAVLAESG